VSRERSGEGVVLRASDLPTVVQRCLTRTHASVLAGRSDRIPRLREVSKNARRMQSAGRRSLMAGRSLQRFCSTPHPRFQLLPSLMV
jgi:hypothetical protein